LVVMASGK